MTTQQQVEFNIATSAKSAMIAPAFIPLEKLNQFGLLAVSQLKRANQFMGNLLNSAIAECHETGRAEYINSLFDFLTDYDLIGKDIGTAHKYIQDNAPVLLKQNKKTGNSYYWAIEKECIAGFKTDTESMAALFALNWKQAQKPKPKQLKVSSGYKQLEKLIGQELTYNLATPTELKEMRISSPSIDLHGLQAMYEAMTQFAKDEKDKAKFHEQLTRVNNALALHIAAEKDAEQSEKEQAAIDELESERIKAQAIVNARQDLEAELLGLQAEFKALDVYLTKAHKTYHRIDSQYKLQKDKQVTAHKAWSDYSGDDKKAKGILKSAYTRIKNKAEKLHIQIGDAWNDINKNKDVQKNISADIAKLQKRLAA